MMVRQYTLFSPTRVQSAFEDPLAMESDVDLNHSIMENGLDCFHTLTPGSSLSTFLASQKSPGVIIIR